MLEKRPLPARGELWRHHKGCEWEILGVGNHSETDAHLVACVRPGKTTNLRFTPVRTFMSAIGDGETPRFEKIKEATP